MNDQRTGLQILTEKWCHGLDVNVDAISNMIDNCDESEMEQRIALSEIVAELKRQSIYLADRYGITVIIVDDNDEDDVQH